VNDDSPRVEARVDVAALNNPKPPYPLAARRLGLEGRVLLAARVTADGACAEVRLKQSSGHALLDASALESVRRWRFLPARHGDSPVESWVEVPVSFRLHDTTTFTVQK
jgi:protein TonB